MNDHAPIQPPTAPERAFDLVMFDLDGTLIETAPKLPMPPTTR